MLYFIDESGTDLKDSPCMVLAAVAIDEERLWSFVTEAIALKRKILAMITLHEWEPKGSNLLTRKMFKLAKQLPPITPYKRHTLLKSLYNKNKKKLVPTKEELTAFGQASLDYVDKLLDLASTFNIKVFGSVFPNYGRQTKGSELRKDYAYLFQRIYLHLTKTSLYEKGIIIFDEMDKSLAERLIRQMRRYFIYTHRGRERSKKIIPEPFFVHSDLTTATQLADIIAYIINFGLQNFAKEEIVEDSANLPEMKIYKRDTPIRKELKDMAEKVSNLQFRETGKDHEGNDRIHYGIIYIKDLRTKSEKLGKHPDV